MEKNEKKLKKKWKSKIEKKMKKIIEKKIENRKLKKKMKIGNLKNFKQKNWKNDIFDHYKNLAYIFIAHTSCGLPF